MNRLKNEKSPYLQQHSENPVDWFPWCDEAFEIAQQQDKPIFLSIGYATCHWCHVMEHESFEDPEVADLMNRAFVNIKVDREERPDIDHTYMTICQMITGQGGWPLTIIMTPEKKPFYAATYLPKASRFQRIGMMDLIPSIENAWKNDRPKIMEAVERIELGFSKTLELGKNSTPLPDDIISQTFQSLINRYDPVHGGFGSAPKFPSAHNILFLINYYRSSENTKALEMATHSLKKMRMGGIWDHIGFGFHRYSTDQKWLLPHFEKMLYDQAMLMLAYAEAWAETGEHLFKKTVYEISEYIDKHLTSKDGVFYSAQDADSEGEEGKFYIWSTDEIQKILSEEESSLFLKYYQVHEEGNYEDEVTGRKTGKSIPHIEEPYEAFAAQMNIETDQLMDRLESIRKRLEAERFKRIHPLLDDKILTDWNGLMMAAYARAGAIFNESDFVDKATTAWSHLMQMCLNKDGELLHRLKDRDAAIDGMADDYSFVIFGLMELYDVTFHPKYLITAIQLQKNFNRNFLDKEFGGYFFTSEKSDSLLGRQKEIYDGAIPSSNSVSALNGYRLFALTADQAYADQSDKIYRAFSEQIIDAPAGYTYALNALLWSTGKSTQIIITSPVWDPDLKNIVQSTRSKAPANTSIIVVTDEWREQLESYMPFIKNYPSQEQHSIYICQNYQCKTPVYNLTDALELLDQI